MSFLKEFKDFALKGNVLDLAVGVIIGAAFGTLVKSMVDDIIMPVIGNLVGKTSFTNLYLNLSGTSYANVEDARKAGASIIPYGNFLQNVVNFLIIAFCVFLIVKIANTAIRKKAAEPVSPIAPEEVLLLREIRDQLKK